VVLRVVLQTCSWSFSVFDLVVVLGLDIAEDIPDDGTDAGEHQAGHYDACKMVSLQTGTDGLRARPTRDALRVRRGRCAVLLRTYPSPASAPNSLDHVAA
jgi:hypothetical protein